MKIVNLDEHCMTIFLNKFYLKNSNFDIKKDLESYFKSLFSKLKKYYNINISGYYNIDIYIDDNYGLVMNLKKEEIEYYDYFDNQIDMRIALKNNKFLYNVIDPFLNNDLLGSNNIVYLYNGKYYIDIMDNINAEVMMKLVEFSNIIFDEEVDDIRKSKKISLNMI